MSYSPQLRDAIERHRTAIERRNRLRVALTGAASDSWGDNVLTSARDLEEFDRVVAEARRRFVAVQQAEHAVTTALREIKRLKAS